MLHWRKPAITNESRALQPKEHQMFGFSFLAITPHHYSSDSRYALVKHATNRVIICFLGEFYFKDCALRGVDAVVRTF